MIIFFPDVWRRPPHRIVRSVLPEDGSTIVRFEIPFARVMPPTNINEASRRYVAYDLNIRQESIENTDPNPVTIERRYSDFLNLYETLSKEHPTLMNGVKFPGKVFMGNFSADLIGQRSAAFEAFLDHIVSSSKLRETHVFLEFLQEKELSKACRLLDERRNEMAVPLLEDCFRLLNKIFLDRSKCVLLLLCRLVAAATTSPVPHPNAEKWAELSLRRFDGVSDFDLLTLYVPLLHNCVHLWWQRGRDNQFLLERLNSMKSKGIMIKDETTLTQAIHALDPRTETV